MERTVRILRNVQLVRGGFSRKRMAGFCDQMEGDYGVSPRGRLLDFLQPHFFDPGYS